MTYKEHHMQCAVSSWHRLNEMCGTCVLLCLQVPRQHLRLACKVLKLRGLVSDEARVVVTLELLLHGFQQSCNI